MKRSGELKDKASGTLSGSLGDLCASVVNDYKNSFTTETPRITEIAPRNSPLPPSLLCIVLVVFATVSSIVAQQSSPTPTPRPGRSYSSEELPKAPPPPGPK